MFPLAVITIFIGSVLATSALAHDEKRWRYAAGMSVISAAMLALWVAQILRRLMQFFSLDLHPLLAGLMAAIPFCLILWQLAVRRRNTPRHSPSLDDDPVLRRYIAEKARRLRKRRQEEEALENADTPL